VQIILKKREARNAFREIWTTIVDPKDKFIDRSKPSAPGRVVEIQRSGDPATKVDLLILGDGYTRAELGKFERDARRLAEILFSTSPFKERRRDFNVWGLCPVSAESGISRPSTGIHHDSPLGTTYDAFGSERYVLTFDNPAFRKIASFAPYDFVEILVNNQTYGGGGIFGLYSTVSADNLYAPYVFVHEFGHHFAGLADEYYTSDVAYAPATDRVEPWEPNVTALLDPARLKWKDLVSPGTPLPTPWGKERFEKYSADVQARRRKIRAENRPEAEMDALFGEQLRRERELFARDPHRDHTRTDQFCSVCRRAISRVIDLYTRG
jgi:hypothetical protein